jgi:hypothetical protein
MDKASKAAALERAMKDRDPSTWDRVKRLFGRGGTEWADNANALLPGAVSGRDAVQKRRKRDAMLDDLNRSE